MATTPQRFDEEFGDFEVVGELGNTYSARTPAEQEEERPEKSTSEPRTADKAVQNVPSTVSMDLETVKNVVAANVGALVSRSEASTEASLRELHCVLKDLTSTVAKRNGTHDRRLRTLEYCFDDYESDIRELGHSVSGLKKKTDEQAAYQMEVLDAVRRSINETNVITSDSAARIDRLIVKYLPSIEATLQGLKVVQDRQESMVVRELHGLKKKLEGVDISELIDVRRIAAKAHLRSLLVEKKLCGVKSDVYMAVALEIHNLQEEAFRHRKESAARFQRLDDEREEMQLATANLDRRAKWIEDVVPHIVGTVLVNLEGRVQEQQEQLRARELEMASADKRAAEREAVLIDRIGDLEGKVDRMGFLQLENAKLKLRMSYLESAFNRLSAQIGDMSEQMKMTAGGPPSPASVTQNSVALNSDLAHAFMAQAERGPRSRAGPLNPSVSAVRAEFLRRALRAEILRRGIRAEVRRRELRRRRRALPTAVALRAELLKRELRKKAAAAAAKRANVFEVVSVRALKAEILRRQIAAEIARRRNSPYPSTRAAAISETALKAELLKRQLRKEIAFRSKRGIRLTVPVRMPPPKPERLGTVNIHCKTLTGEGIDVQVPPFVSIRYLKQLIYFKTGCSMHPTHQNLVYAGKVLQDGWKVGGGMFSVSPSSAFPSSASSSPLSPTTDDAAFTGIQDEATVLIVIKKKFLD